MPKTFKKSKIKYKKSLRGGVYTNDPGNVNFKDPFHKKKENAYKYLYEDIIDSKQGKTELIKNIIKVDDNKKDISSRKISTFIGKNKKSFSEMILNKKELEHYEMLIGLIPKKKYVSERKFESLEEYSNYIRNNATDQYLRINLVALSKEIKYLNDKGDIHSLGIVKLSQYNILMQEVKRRDIEREKISEPIVSKYDKLLLQIAMTDPIKIKDVVKKMTNLELATVYKYTKRFTVSNIKRGNPIASLVFYELYNEFRIRLTRDLLKRGWSVKDIQKHLFGNEKNI